MSLFQIFNVAGSATSAQTQRLNVVASNLANADTVAGPDGQAYKARQVVFQTQLMGEAAGAGGAAGAAGVRARFERAVQRGAARGIARFVERVHFRVRLAGPLVRPLADHDAVVRHHARADERIGGGAPQPSAGMLDRPPHPPRVVYHFV